MKHRPLQASTDKALLKAIKVHTDGQKQVPPTHILWTIASRCLEILYAEMAHRYPNGTGPRMLP